MNTRLTAYGSPEYAHNLAKVGKSKTPHSLAGRMPSPEIAAKVGAVGIGLGARTRRVVRLNTQG
jgi:hypothetical protein